ncbi:PmbA protein [Pacificibacter maritimus]|uniref:PmbA protein n=1 Tax=Pacificibacter maritimus TaxID=762213 RepID=A0A3N4UI85_9RHOB|nr:TldD/PmbA family protein [Pacificibacter maritimus]RPE64837.1 PmbA protein [Pacificibacter maritimus]
MQKDLSQLTQALLHAAQKHGADNADAIAVTGTSISIDVRAGALEHAERSEGVDIGLRVFVGQKQACVSASDVRDETLETIAERAVAMAKLSPDDPYIGLADADQLAEDRDCGKLELFDATAEPAAADLEDDARRAEATALEHSGISKVQSASAGYGRRQVHLAASNGFSGGYERSDRAISCVAIAGSGTQMERDYFGDSRIFQADLMTPEEVGQRAAENTLARLGARKPKTGTFPVIFDERISSTLLGHLMAAVNGSMIARGSSWLRDDLGQSILPSHISIIEQPHRKRTSGSRLFDSEGLPTKERHIVENGTLMGWTLDLATARQLGLTSTANAGRGVGSPPSPAPTNLAMTQGPQSQADLLKDMGTGLLVTSLIGSSVNPNTGDYSRGASGFWVENGVLAYPVNECTIAGNLRDMLKTIVTANDARMHLSRVVPSILVESMTLAGA